MDIDKIITLAELLVKYAQPIIGILFFYFLAKGKNSLLNHHLWKSKLNIDIDIKNPHLAKFVEEKIDLEKLSLHYPKINFYSLEHALELLKWAKNNNVSYGELIRIQSCLPFNRKNPSDIQFKLPKITYFEEASSKFFAVTFFLLFITISYAAPFSGFGNSILIKTKTSDIFLLINKNKTITYENIIFGESQNTGFEKCRSNLNTKGITEKESTALCDLIKEEKDIISYFQSSKQDTAITLSIMLPILAIGFIYFIYMNLASSKLINFEKYINPKKSIGFNKQIKIAMNFIILHARLMARRLGIM